MSVSILVVDDHPHIREVIGFALQNAGFSARFAPDGLSALSQIKAKAPALMVLDIGLPEIDGLEVCRRVRQSSQLPILFLTARDDEIDRIVGLELGADDYVTKPFSPRELVARVKAILKRSAPVVAEPKRLVWGDLEIDIARHYCGFAGQAVLLTASEFGLLAKLVESPENVVTRSQLLMAVYGGNIHVSDRTIDSHIRNIRAKLAEAGCTESIATIHGVGLRMAACLKT